MAVGDVNSQARGAGARYNDGKVPLELIPAWILARFDRRPSDKLSALDLMVLLGEWQAGACSALDIIERLPYAAAEDAASVFAYGARKYAAWNWIKGMAWSVPLGCALRHALADMRGEMLDPESGHTHRGHLVCNLVMLAQFERTYPEGDDRPVEWLNPKVDSTDEPAAPTGGPGSPAAPASPPESETEIEQPTSYDPPGRGREPFRSEGLDALDAWYRLYCDPTSRTPRPRG